MTRWLALFLMLLHFASAETLLRATTMGTLSAFRNAVALRGPANALVWRVYVPGHDILELGEFDGKVLVFAAAKRENGWVGHITALSKQNGRRLWTKFVSSPLSVGQFGRDWGVVEDMLWITSVESGAYTTTSVHTYRLSDGAPRGRAEGVSGVVARRAHLLLLRRSGPGGPFRDYGRIELLSMDLKSGARRSVTFLVRPRPGCGPLDDSSEDTEERADDTFLYARRADRCGSFVARFDWHGDEAQAPLLIPQR